MKKRQLISFVILIAVLVASAIYLKSHDELLLALSNISLGSALLLIISRTLIIATNGLFLQAFASKFDVHLRIKEWFGLAVVTAMGNYLTPFSGGMVVRAAYLKHRHALPYAKFATLLASNYLIAFWVIGFVGIILLVGFAPFNQFYWQITLFFLFFTGTISVLAFWPAVRLPGNNRLVNVLNSSLDGWVKIKNDKQLLLKLIIYTLISVFLNGFSFWIAYYALGFSVSFVAALFISLLAGFTIFLNITPGNLGIQEAAIGLSSALLGVGTGQGLLAGFLIRAATLIVVFILGPIFSYILTRNVIPPESTRSSSEFSE